MIDGEGKGVLEREEAGLVDWVGRLRICGRVEVEVIDANYRPLALWLLLFNFYSYKPCANHNLADMFSLIAYMSFIRLTVGRDFQ